MVGEQVPPRIVNAANGGAGTAQHGLPSGTMALITLDCGSIQAGQTPGPCGAPGASPSQRIFKGCVGCLVGLLKDALHLLHHLVLLPLRQRLTEHVLAYTCSRDYA